MNIDAFHSPRPERPDRWLRVLFAVPGLLAYAGVAVWLVLMVGFSEGGWLDRIVEVLF